MGDLTHRHVKLLVAETQVFEAPAIPQQETLSPERRLNRMKFCLRNSTLGWEKTWLCMLLCFRIVLV